MDRAKERTEANLSRPERHQLMIRRILKNTKHELGYGTLAFGIFPCRQMHFATLRRCMYRSTKEHCVFGIRAYKS